MKIHLVVIDPQNDFCSPTGALSVVGADADMQRLAAMIESNVEKIDEIQVTLDSHQLVHIAHPIFWVNSVGEHPKPFTLIKMQDVEGQNAVWRAFNPAFQKRAVEYVKKLEANGRYVLCIWPPHCIIGTHGHSVFPVLSDALIKWQAAFATVDFVTKGSNPFTEHYSAVKADVPDPSDLMNTGLNKVFIDRLRIADKILIAGEASSHCVRFTLTDIIREFGPQHAKKFVILRDAMSPVPTFEQFETDFFDDMKKLGVEFSTTTTFFA